MGHDDDITRLQNGIADLLLRIADILLQLRKSAGLSHDDLRLIVENINREHEEAAQAVVEGRRPRGEDEAHPSEAAP